MSFNQFLILTQGSNLKIFKAVVKLGVYSLEIISDLYFNEEIVSMERGNMQSLIVVTESSLKSGVYWKVNLEIIRLRESLPVINGTCPN